VLIRGKVSEVFAESVRGLELCDQREPITDLLHSPLFLSPTYIPNTSSVSDESVKMLKGSHTARAPDKLRLRDFYDRFSLSGADRLSGIRHPSFDFYLDGLTAAVALARYSIQARQEEEPSKHRKVCQVLLEQMVDPADMVSSPFLHLRAADLA
jgi:hypothetical protein